MSEQQPDSMHTDHELLVHAARAAGIGTEYIRGRWVDNRFVVWNPLKDDGDALRLAVKRSIRVEMHPSWVYSAAWSHESLCGLGQRFEEPHNGDPAAATRRAIVRAAAEEGKAAGQCR